MYSNQTPTPTNNTEAFLDHDDADLGLLGGIPGTSLSPHTPCAEEDGLYEGEFPDDFVLDDGAHEALQGLDNTDEEQLLSDQNELGSEQDADEGDLGASGQNQESTDVEERPQYLGRSDSGDSSVSTDSSEEESESLAERAARLDAERAAALKTQEEQKRLSALGKIEERRQRGEQAPGYDQPVFDKDQTDEFNQDAYDYWLGWCKLWKDAKDAGYLEYQTKRKKKMAELTAARRAQEAADRKEAQEKREVKRLRDSLSLPKKLHKGETPEAFAVRQAAKKQLREEIANDPTHELWGALQERLADEEAYRARERARKANRKPSPAQRRPTSRQSAPNAPPAPPKKTDFSMVRKILLGSLEKLVESVEKEKGSAAPGSKHAGNLAAYLTDAKACYAEADKVATDLEKEGKVVPNMGALQANDCWNDGDDAPKTAKQLIDQVTAQLNRLRYSPSGREAFPLRGLLKNLEWDAWVNKDDAEMVPLKMQEMDAAVADALGNQQFQSEAASDDPESNRSEVLRDLKSKGFLGASPHDLAKWMLSLNTQNTEAALTILNGAWDSSTQLAMLVRTAVDQRIPSVGVCCDELGLLREALADPEEGGEDAPVLEVVAPCEGEENTQVAKQLEVCKSLHTTLGDLKKDKSATPEAVQHAQQAFESTRKGLAGFGKFLTVRYLADGTSRVIPKDKKELKGAYDEVKQWAQKQAKWTEESLKKGSLTTVDRAFALQRRLQLCPHFAEELLDFARSLYGSILEYFNAQFYMCLLVLSTLAPEFCSTPRFSFRRGLFSDNSGRSEATPHEVAAWVLEKHTNFPNLERPSLGAVAHFRYHHEGKAGEEGDTEVNSEATEEPAAKRANTGVVAELEAKGEELKDDEEVDPDAEGEEQPVDEDMLVEDHQGAVEATIDAPEVPPPQEEKAPPQETEKEAPRKSRKPKRKPHCPAGGPTRESKRLRNKTKGA